MGKLTIKKVDSDTMEEVVAYEKALQEWNDFRDANPTLFEMLDVKVADLEQKRQAAEKAVRTADVSCGPMEQTQRFMSVDGKKLLAAVGREEAVNCGANISETVTVKVDMKRYELAKAQGRVEREVAEDVEEVNTRYKVPKELRLP